MLRGFQHYRKLLSNFACIVSFIHFASSVSLRNSLPNVKVFYERIRDDKTMAYLVKYFYMFSHIPRLHAAHFMLRMKGDIHKLLLAILGVLDTFVGFFPRTASKSRVCHLMVPDFMILEGLGQAKLFPTNCTNVRPFAYMSLQMTP